MKSIDKYTHWLFLLLFIVLPISKGIASTCEVILILLSFLKFKGSDIRSLISENKHVAGVSLIFICFLIGMIYTSDLKEGLRVLERQHRLLVFPFIILLNLTLVRKEGIKYIFAFIIGTVFTSLVTIIFYLVPEIVVIKFVA